MRKDVLKSAIHDLPEKAFDLDENLWNFKEKCVKV